jgi:putative membrane-bound dehydrogenase-like protein
MRARLVHVPVQPVRLASVLVVAAGLLSSAAGAAPPTPEKSPVEAEASLTHFQLPDDLAIELVAAEPEVIDPIDVRFDEHGRLWVVEMRDYPTGPKEGGPPLSRIKLLEDRDGDGRFETAHVFAENLPFITGVQPWRGGVIVTLAGRVAYLKDTTGDHRADQIETWFTGFAEENSQLRANHPRLGADNHIYIANGLRGGKVIDLRQEEPPQIDISGRDFRFDPRGSGAEAVTGMGQYGLAFDNFGNRFVCQNRNPVQHVVFEERDLKKSTLFTPPAVMNDVAAFGEHSRLFPLTQTWTTSNLHENQFTAACGINFYRGNALPSLFYPGLAFTCDPTGNLVHAERLVSIGPSFEGGSLFKDREFLASTDEWFRPVAIENGPDGALYVVDMYRAVIEHPDWVPDELKKRPDERFGDDRGRIYRIVAKGRKKAKPVLPFEKSARDLVGMLADGNAWHRETAQRLLIEAEDRSIEPQLASLLKQEKFAVFHSLWTLHGLGLLKIEHLRVTAKSEDPDILRTTARLYDLAGFHDVELRASLVKHPHIAGIWTPLAPLTAEELVPRAAYVASESTDEWSQAEMLLAIEKPASVVLRKAVLDNADSRSTDFARKLSRIAGAIDDLETLDALLLEIESRGGDEPLDALSRHALLGLADGLATRGKRLAEIATSDGAKRVVERWLESSLAGVVEQTASVEDRLSHLEALQRLNPVEARPAILRLTTDRDQAVRIAALRAALSWGDAEQNSALLQRAPSESPAVKRVILEGLCASPVGTTLVLDAIEAERLKPTDLDPTLTPRLMNSGPPELRERARKLLTPPVDPDRQHTIATYMAALKETADPQRGRTLFEKNCAQCHRVGDVGISVAPDISDSRTKTSEQILLDILEPNRAVDGNYVAYIVVTDEGKTLTGVIAAESSQAITLKQPGGEAVVIPRSTIEEIASTGKSFMPEGLERAMSPQEMADVVSYVKNWRYLDGRIPASSVTN